LLKKYISCYIELHTERTVLLKDLKFFNWIQEIRKVILLNYQNYVERSVARISKFFAELLIIFKVPTKLF